MNISQCTEIQKHVNVSLQSLCFAANNLYQYKMNSFRQAKETYQKFLSDSDFYKIL